MRRYLNASLLAATAVLLIAALAGSALGGAAVPSGWAALFNQLHVSTPSDGGLQVTTSDGGNALAIKAGSVTNAMLGNSSLTVSTPSDGGLQGGATVALGSTVTLRDTSTGVVPDGGTWSVGSAGNVPIVAFNQAGKATSAISTPVVVASSSNVTGLDTQLAAKAPLASPTFTGTVTLPVGATVGTAAPVLLKGGAQTESATASGLDADTPADWSASGAISTNGNMQRWKNNGTVRARIIDDFSLGVHIVRLLAPGSYAYFETSDGATGGGHLKLSDSALFVGIGESVTFNFTSAGIFPQTSASKDLGIEGQAFKRLRLKGTAIVAGDFALSAGWGTTASVGTITGDDSHAKFTVTSTGTGQGASPTTTLTFKNGTWTTVPFCDVRLRAVTGTLTMTDVVTWVESATTLVITHVATPTAADTATYSIICIGSSAT